MIHTMPEVGTGRADSRPMSPAFGARLLKARTLVNLRPAKVRDFVRYGASPRGLQAMILAGKIVALMMAVQRRLRDIRQVAIPAMRHRLIPQLRSSG